ncbi:MAG: phenylalanine--tRNA ligase subunit beta [Ignavibacteria bacterium RBG_16_34_14]|nr:MAG: phenylalanine--tRNA ligase subunit beta [Ignavibacteria bacterium RBG_16_34_14]
MKASLNWTKEYVNLEGIPVQEIIDKLTMSGLEVEDFVNQQEIYKDFVVGLVTSKEKHPNADKLSLCKVNTGSEELIVVCGAANVASGQKIVFAPVGTIIPLSGMKLGRAKIRGVESFGMICSEAELGLGNDASGIMVIDKKLKEGTPFSKALGFDDVILEIAITPNRPDALSHIGIARDLAAIFNRELKYPELKIDEAKDEAKNYASIEILDTKNCPRYSSRIIRNVTVKESPEWLKSKLTKIGLRPINNIVDVTNFVMNELGQPLHAFNLDQLSGRKIIVKSTKEKMKFTTLDSKDRELPSGTLMICDGEKEVAIAGVMGGENSEVTSETKNILLESAHFNPSHIRKVSKALGLNSDASYRFERTVDPNNTDYAVNRASMLIAEVSGGEILKGLIDVYPEKIKEKEVQLRFARVKKVLGYEIPKESINKILNKLGLKTILQSQDEIRLQVPTYRPDLEREVDLIEEVARIYGYDQIPAVPKITITLEKKYDESVFTDEIREIATGLGLYEILNNPLIDERSASFDGRPIKILNPQSVDMAYLRTSLIPGGLIVAANNINKGEKNLSFFEIGNIFNKISENEINSFEDFIEERRLLFILTGKERKKKWNSTEKVVDFFLLKGLVDSFITKFSLDNVLNDSYYHSGNRNFAYYFTKNLKEKVIGLGGKVSKDVLKQYDIDQDVYCFELYLEELKEIQQRKKFYSLPIKFPKVVRDFAFILDKYITYEELINFIKAEGSNLLNNVKLFDLFENESIGNDKKSMAFSLEYQAKDRTLTEDEVEKEFLHLIKLIEKKFNAKLRGI